MRLNKHRIRGALRSGLTRVREKSVDQLLDWSLNGHSLALLTSFGHMVCHFDSLVVNSSLSSLVFGGGTEILRVVVVVGHLTCYS